MKGRETITDIYNVLEGIEKALDRIADVLELDREDRKGREERTLTRYRERVEQEERELAEAETRYPGITAEVRNTAFVPPF